MHQPFKGFSSDLIKITLKSSSQPSHKELFHHCNDQAQAVEPLHCGCNSFVTHTDINHTHHDHYNPLNYILINLMIIIYTIIITNPCKQPHFVQYHHQIIAMIIIMIIMIIIFIIIIIIIIIIINVFIMLLYMNKLFKGFRSELISLKSSASQHCCITEPD